MDQMVTGPTIAKIERARSRIASAIVETPAVPWPGTDLAARLAPGTDVCAKLELLQRTGTFKPRGALLVMLHLSDEEKARGITTVSAGNHAIAVSYAAHILGLSAKVVMHRKANPFRVAQCRRYGAEVVQMADIPAAFDEADRIQREEGRALVHPFEGPYTSLGTATVGLELCRQAGELDAVIVPIGGGGLISGVAAAVKQLRPGCAVYGVEPVGAQGMSQSLAQGAPLPKVEIDTIGDSLGPSKHLPYSFGLVQRYVDDVVLVEDADLIEAMGFMFRDVKLAVEPAGAAATAALMGPLKDRLAGRRVALVICGSNIDFETYAGFMARGRDS